jgi:hypothetical protein
MALTKEELRSLDNEASTKGDLKEALSKHESDHPGLDEVTTDQTREQMVTTAEEAIDAGLTAEGKRRALQRLLDQQPNAVLMPVRQAWMRLNHPQNEDEFFVLNVFTEMGSKDKPSPTDPENDVDLTEKPDVDQVDVDVTPLGEVPDWVLPQLYDLIMSGDVEVFDSPADAQRKANQQVKGTQQPMLDEPSRPVNLESKVDEDMAGIGDDDAPVVTEPQANFRRPEQWCAWNVLARPVNGEQPLPERPEEISADPNDLTDAELTRVERRIRNCLEAPQRYYEDANRQAFEERVFFDQLLECEMDGANAPRNSNQKIGGISRPQVVKIIREIANERGFDVVGAFVSEQPDNELERDLPETVPMTPEGDRQHDPTSRPETRR